MLRNILLGFILAVVLWSVAGVAVRMYQAHQLTKATAVYLFSETPVKDKDGKPLSRADLLDAILRDAIQKAQ